MAQALSGVDKAAMLLVLLGEDASSGIMKHFEEAEIRAVGRAVSALGGIDPGVAQRVLEEYRDRIVTHKDVAAGGPHVAQRMVESSLSPERAAVVGSSMGAGTGKGDPGRELDPEIAEQFGPFALLAAVGERDLGQTLELEHPQTAALVLLHLPPPKAAAALEAMSEESQAGIATRMSRVSEFPSEVAREVSEALRARFDAQRVEGMEERDGGLAAAEILKRMERSKSRSLLARIETTDPDIANLLRSRVYTFEMLLQLDDRGVQELLKGVDAKQLALALKGTTPEVVEKFLKNMSTRASELVRDEMEFLGVAKVADVEAAQKEILDKALRLEEEGTLSFAAPEGSALAQ